MPRLATIGHAPGRPEKTPATGRAAAPMKPWASAPKLVSEAESDAGMGLTERQ